MTHHGLSHFQRRDSKTYALNEGTAKSSHFQRRDSKTLTPSLPCNTPFCTLHASTRFNTPLRLSSTQVFRLVRLLVPCINSFALIPVSILCKILHMLRFQRLQDQPAPPFASSVSVNQIGFSRSVRFQLIKFGFSQSLRFQSVSSVL